MAFNDLTVDTASDYAGRPDQTYEAFVASLIFSLLFHRQAVFLDAHVVNNPGLRKTP